MPELQKKALANYSFFGQLNLGRLSESSKAIASPKPACSAPDCALVIPVIKASQILKPSRILRKHGAGLFKNGGYYAANTQITADYYCGSSYPGGLKTFLSLMGILAQPYIMTL